MKLSWLRPRTGDGPRPVSLALQGGGAHGAFTWGVLDALLEQGGLHIEAVSGTSAGAMNAIVLAHGLLDGGAEGARAALERFWRAVAAQVPAGTVHPGADDAVPALSAPAQALLQWSRLLSPYQLNPLNLNPLREVLQAQVDFARLRATPGPRLFIAATHANTGQLRLFRREDLSVEVALASACLPTLMQAVQIDGEPYWDGGYAANPALLPLVREAGARDLLIVALNPRVFGELPRTAAQIQQRALEIGFNACFLHELRWLQQLQASAREGWWPALAGPRRRLADLRVHLIEADAALGALPLHTKLVAHAPFLALLRERGCLHARQWLDVQGRHIGLRSSADLSALCGLGSGAAAVAGAAA